MVAPNTVIPPFSKVCGRPGVVVEELPETAQETLERMWFNVFGFFWCNSANRLCSKEHIPHGMIRGCLTSGFLLIWGFLFSGMESELWIIILFNNYFLARSRWRLAAGGLGKLMQICEPQFLVSNILTVVIRWSRTLERK